MDGEPFATAPPPCPTTGSATGTCTSTSTATATATATAAATHGDDTPSASGSDDDTDVVVLEQDDEVKMLSSEPERVSSHPPPPPVVRPTAAEGLGAAVTRPPALTLNGVEDLRACMTAGGLEDVTLFPFQETGVLFMWNHMVNGGSILADEMGLGKTIQAIGLIAALRGWYYVHGAHDVGTTSFCQGVIVILVPVNVLGYWHQQLQRHLPRQHVLLINRGPALEKCMPEVTADTGTCIVLSTHAMFTQNCGLKRREVTAGPAGAGAGAAARSSAAPTTSTSFMAALKGKRVSLVFVDEAHRYVNPATGNHRSVLALQRWHRRTPFGLYLLTGTPLGSKPVAIANYFALLKMHRWATPEWWDTAMQACGAAVGEDMSHPRAFILQRRKADVMDTLPARRVVCVSIVPTGDEIDVDVNVEALVYNTIMARVIDIIHCIIREMASVRDTAPHGPEGQLRLRRLREAFYAGMVRAQDALFFPQLLPEKSLPEDVPASALPASTVMRQAIVRAVVAHVTTTKRGVLLQSYWTRWLRLLKQDLETRAGLRVAFFNGSLSALQRAHLVRRFQAGEFHVACLTLGCAEGITLTHATCVIDVGYWPNPALHEQGYDRVHRIGQTEVVTVQKLCATVSVTGLLRQTLHHAMVATQAARTAAARHVLGQKAAKTSRLAQDIENMDNASASRLMHSILGHHDALVTAEGGFEMKLE